MDTSPSSVVIAASAHTNAMVKNEGLDMDMDGTRSPELNVSSCEEHTVVAVVVTPFLDVVW
jgi:hypothetical protein